MQIAEHHCSPLMTHITAFKDKNSSGDEIANVNFLRQYCTYFKKLKKRTYFV